TNCTDKVLNIFTRSRLKTNNRNINLHSFPTRRSSDLETHGSALKFNEIVTTIYQPGVGPWTGTYHGDWALGPREAFRVPLQSTIDRKSTRLNSSHRTISYAVFCLKKKKQCRKTKTLGT